MYHLGRFTFYRQAFSNLSQLRSLYLNNNHLSFLPDGFLRSSTHLTFIQLDNNVLNMTVSKSTEDSARNPNEFSHCSNNRANSVLNPGFSRCSPVEIHLRNNSVTRIFQDWLRCASFLDLGHNKLQNLTVSPTIRNVLHRRIFKLKHSCK